ncbi:MAG: hypothetical protein IKN39_04160 [Clostridia bacterium]|nr:hypothetical protein [Clostridia bacterium]
MKKVISALFVALLLFCLSACGGKTINHTAGNNTKTVADVLNGDSDNLKSDNVAGNTSKSVSILNEKCDVDLTTMSSTMVYAEVSNMMLNPDDYVGKIVKMKGNFSVYLGEMRNYYACVIADATACCSQGIEFVLLDDIKYPDEYPEPGTEITVVGRFETYIEGTDTYCQLSDSKMS